MLRVFAVLLLTLAAVPAFACCIFDRDALHEEAVRYPDAFDIIAGRIDRQTPQWHEAMIERGLRAEITGDPVTDRLRAAASLDQLNRQPEAIDLLLSTIEQLTPAQAQRARAQVVQSAMHHWWNGGTEQLPAERALQIAREHNEQLPNNALMTHIIDWADKLEPADERRMLPDFFTLRLAGNKVAIEDNNQLELRGVKGAAEFLLHLLRLHPAWENFDTYYTLSVVWAVDGKQTLAHYARARAWLMHNNGQFSRSPGADEFTDIRPLTLIRARRGPALTDVTPVTMDYRAEIQAWLLQVRRYAMAWNRARDEYAQARLEGTAADAPDFWADFTPPPRDLPDPPVPAPPRPDEANVVVDAPASAPTENPDAPRISQAPKREESSGIDPLTWGMLGGLVVLLGAGVFLHRRATAGSRHVSSDQLEAGEAEADDEQSDQEQDDGADSQK